MSGRVCTFRVADLCCGIPIDRVVEVVTDLRVTPVPLSSPDIAGLINLRGRILTAVASRSRLGLEPQPAVGGGAHVIISTESGPISLYVDGEGDVVELPAESGEPLPENIAPTIRSHVIAAYQVGDTLVLLLDPDSLLSI